MLLSGHTCPNLLVERHTAVKSLVSFVVPIVANDGSTYTSMWVGRIGASSIAVGLPVSAMLSWNCCANPPPLTVTPSVRLKLSSKSDTIPYVALPALDAAALLNRVRLHGVLCADGRRERVRPARSVHRGDRARHEVAVERVDDLRVGALPGQAERRQVLAWRDRARVLRPSPGTG